MIETSELPFLRLNRAAIAEYCTAAAAAKSNEFWWYFNGLAPWRGYSRPFPDDAGRWWYRVKPGFAWPVNFFDPISQDRKSVV